MIRLPHPLRLLPTEARRVGLGEESMPPGPPRAAQGRVTEQHQTRAHFWMETRESVGQTRAVIVSDDQHFPPSGELLFGEDFEQVLAHQAGGVEVWGRGSGSPARAEEVGNYEREVKGQEVGEEGGPEVRAVGPAMQQEEGRGGGGRGNRGTVEVVGVEEAAVGIKGVFGEGVHLWQGFACGWGSCCGMGWGGMASDARGMEGRGEDIRVAIGLSYIASAR